VRLAWIDAGGAKAGEEVPFEPHVQPHESEADALYDLRATSRRRRRP
jgi:hypothetical protein